MIFIGYNEDVNRGETRKKTIQKGKEMRPMPAFRSPGDIFGHDLRPFRKDI